MRIRARMRHGEHGFNIPEVMAAMLVLLVGVLGAVTMIDASSKHTAISNERIGATNLARELLEQVRTVPYTQLNAGGIETVLKARPGLGAGTPWTIERRNVSYTVKPTVCTYDDPVDGIATTGSGFCPRGTSAKVDPDGDDFRRVTLRLGWEDRGRTQYVTQTELVVNPSGGLGPRITSFAPVLDPITNSASSSASFTVATASTAWAIRWSADDGVSQGTVSGPGTSFTFNWDLKLQGMPQQVYDGTYQIVAQAFNDRNIPGEAKIAVITINRYRPFAPAALVGGHNTRIGDVVDLEWAPNPERDIIGYRVYYAGADEVRGGGDDELVCPTTAGGWLDEKTTTCQDAAHPDGEGKWFVVALDRDAGGVEQEGAPTYLDVDKPDAQPELPAGPLTATTTGQGLDLDWDPPASGSTPQFYRVYRDGTGFADRLAVVTNGDSHFTDPDSGSHEYWVSAVDDKFNESDLLGPVVSP
jgi:hypothetical protein